MQTPKLQTYREIYPHPLNPPTCDENFRTWKMAGRSPGTEKKGRGRRRVACRSGAKTSPSSAVPPTLIHFPPYLDANYEEGGNKKRASPLLSSLLLLFVLSDLPRSTTSQKEGMNGGVKRDVVSGKVGRWGELHAPNQRCGRLSWSCCGSLIFSELKDVH